MDVVIIVSVSIMPLINISTIPHFINDVEAEERFLSDALTTDRTSQLISELSKHLSAISYYYDTHWLDSASRSIQINMDSGYMNWRLQCQTKDEFVGLMSSYLRVVWFSNLSVIAISFREDLIVKQSVKNFSSSTGQDGIFCNYLPIAFL